MYLSSIALDYSLIATSGKSVAYRSVHRLQIFALLIWKTTGSTYMAASSKMIVTGTKIPLKKLWILGEWTWLFTNRKSQKTRKSTIIEKIKKIKCCL